MKEYQDEYVRALAIAVTTIHDESLSFQVVFGEEANLTIMIEGNNPQRLYVG